MEASSTSQHRIFRQIATRNISPENIHSCITDLYIYKRGFTEFGVKIRNPHITAKGNYKFKKVQVKIERLKHANPNAQAWLKFLMPLGSEFKLKENTVKQLNTILKEAISSKAQLREALAVWASKEIDFIVRVDKVKDKSYSKEKGELTLGTIFPDGDKQSFMTESREGLTVEAMEQMGQNTSYPQLLQQLYSCRVSH